MIINYLPGYLTPQPCAYLYFTNNELLCCRSKLTAHQVSLLMQYLLVAVSSKIGETLASVTVMWHHCQEQSITPALHGVLCTISANICSHLFSPNIWIHERIKNWFNNEIIKNLLCTWHYSVRNVQNPGDYNIPGELNSWPKSVLNNII